MPNSDHVSRKASCSMRVQAKGFELGAKGPATGMVLGQGTEVDNDDRCVGRFLRSAAAPFLQPLAASPLRRLPGVRLSLVDPFFSATVLAFHLPPVFFASALVASSVLVGRQHGFHLGLPFLPQQVEQFGLQGVFPRVQVRDPALGLLAKVLHLVPAPLRLEHRVGIGLASLFVTLQRLEMGLDLLAVFFDELVQAVNVPFIDFLGLGAKLLVKPLAVVLAVRRAVKIDEPLPQVVPRLGQLENLRRLAVGVFGIDLGQIAFQPLVAVDIGQHAVEEAGHRPAGAGEESFGFATNWSAWRIFQIPSYRKCQPNASRRTTSITTVQRPMVNLLVFRGYLLHSRNLFARWAGNGCRAVMGRIHAIGLPDRRRDRCRQLPGEFHCNRFIADMLGPRKAAYGTPSSGWCNRIL